MALPTLGQMLLGTEGLALLRLAATDDAAARAPGSTRSDRCSRARKPSLPPRSTRPSSPSSMVRLWSQTYDAPLRLFPVEEPAVRRLLSNLPPGRILDAACGTGRHSQWLVAKGHDVIGVDVSPDMLARARAKLPGGRFEQGDLTALPLPDASVDAALCALALVHLPDLRPAFTELARVVRPGGPDRDQRRAPVPGGTRLAGAVPHRRRAAPASSAYTAICRRAMRRPRSRRDSPSSISSSRCCRRIPP